MFYRKKLATKAVFNALTLGQNERFAFLRATCYNYNRNKSNANNSSGIKCLYT
jgi:hypothetical protein